MNIRDETPADEAAITALTRAAFANAEHTSHTEEYIVLALRRRGKLSVSLVAEDEGGLVGHVALSPVTLSDGSQDWYGLGPISVLPARQRGGVGSALMQAAITRLRTMDAAGCVLLGEPGYYQRFGFQALPSLQLPGVPAEYFMALPLRGDLPLAEVQYDPAFDATA